ncbi:MAG: glycosyltransferase family 2 protein [Candidatus Eisenbacteria bacterium]|uniref:Glycosyltransferase family 2 protein n=1 Tax=Eiseniibacteriota bacterium TaxID=2212470 RepID=A0A538TM86_UNCEI|nr:MAG: glycosyltransferase family 2 protein [Candidatus Eisenbacteria bacterium]
MANVGGDAAPGQAPGLDLTVLVPVLNEAENMRPLVEKIVQDLKPLGKSYEILVIDDGSTDGTFDQLRALAPSTPALRAIRFRRNFGKSAALSSGFREARGRVVVTMDGDLQDDSAEIARLLAKIDEGFDLVSGWKQNRKDSISKTVPSKLFNAVTSAVSGVPLHDMNCGLKAYREEVTRTIHLRGELHRFIPVLAHWSGFRVGEIRTVHHPRIHGKTKFGVSRFLNGFLDLTAVMFLTTSSNRPVHLFGRVGIAFALAGAALTVGYTWPWFLGEGLRLRPGLLFGLVLVILGIQFLSLGFLGEMIAGSRAEEPHYAIRERL